MNILFVTMQYGENCNQGTEKYIKNLSHYLNKKKHIVHVVSANIDNNQTHLDKHFLLTTDGWTTLYGKAGKELKVLLNKNNYDLIHLVHPGHIGVQIIDICKSLHIPIILTMTDYWWICPKNTLIRPDNSVCTGRKSFFECANCISKKNDNQLLTALPNGIIRNYASVSALCLKLLFKGHVVDWILRNKKIEVALSKVDKVITLSKTAQEKVRKQLCSSTSLIPVGIKPKWFIEKKSSVKKKQTIAFIGAIQPHKGLHILLDKPEHLKDFDILIIGKIQNSDYCQKLINKTSEYNNIQWLDQLNEDQLVSTYNEIDIVIAPFLSPENQPQSAIEAIAKKTPLITSDAEGLSELVYQKYTYPMHDSTKLYNLIDRVSKDISNYRFSYQPLPINQMGEKTETLYKKAIQNKKKQYEK